jgi:hypothetical protein
VIKGYKDRNKVFRWKMKNRVGVRNDVIFRTIFQFYKEFYNRFKSNKSPKWVELSTSTNVIKKKFKRVDLEN